MINFHIAILLMLIRKAIWNEDIHAEMFGAKTCAVKDGKKLECSTEIRQQITEEDWARIMKLSIRHAVRAIAYDGVCALGWELPKKIKIQWALGVQSTEQQYEKHVGVATELAELFNNAGLQMTLLKGIGLSLNYPVPNHRECGDIDIYLSDYEKGNEIAREKGLEVNIHYEKHSSFFWDDIEIENHQYFLNEQIFKVDKVLDSYLLKVLNTQPSKVFTGTQILFPPADFNALFLIRHQITHAVFGLNIRLLLDYSTFLQKHHQVINFAELEELLKEQHLDKIVMGMNDVARKYLGQKENYFKTLGHPDGVVSQKVYDYMFGSKAGHKRYKDNAWGTFREKLDKVMTDISQDCKLLHNESPAGLFMRILFRQLGRPAEIFKK